MGNYLYTSTKKLIIVRGLPGSGKTTLAKQFANTTGKIFSNDDYFTEGTTYNFKPEKYDEAVLRTQYNVLDAMKKGEYLIIVDNNNARKWEAKPYVRAAVNFGYTVEFHETNTPWKNNIDELIKKSQHTQTPKYIKRMMKKWETDFTVENVLASIPPQDEINIQDEKIIF
jgi:2',3'-cyclic-nucleotide 3'-phosphodiesterase